MPGRLVLFKQVIPLTADDLAIPCFLKLCTRFISLLALSCFLGVLVREDQNLEAIEISYIASSLGVCFLSFLTYFRLFWVTSSDEILSWEKRTAKTTPLIYLVLVLYIIGLCFAGFGMYLLTVTNREMKQFLFTVELLIVLGILFDFFVFLPFLLFGTFLSTSKREMTRELTDSSYSTTCARLMKCLSILLCGICGNLESPMGYEEMAWFEISRMIHKLVKDTMKDFTLSDLFSAFILLCAEQQQQQQRKQRMENTSIHHQDLVLIKGSDEEAKEIMKDFEDFAPYAIGIYGWKLQVVMNPLQCCLKFPIDICYGADKTVFTREIDAIDKTKRQILYSSFTSYLSEAIPYTITVDHEKKAVVVALRGTLSVGDITSDLLFLPERMSTAAVQWGVPNADKYYAHKGMFTIANRIRLDIEKQQILHRILRVYPRSQENVDRFAEEDAFEHRELFVNETELSQLDCSTYRLICCGHSLGACMATLLSILLKPSFPMVRALGYSNCSGIVSANLAKETESFVFSCTIGDDIFARLNYHFFKDLRNKLIDLLRRSKASKPAIFLTLFRPRPASALLYPIDQIPDDPYRNFLGDLICRLKEEELKDDAVEESVQMMIPGKIIYLKEENTGKQKKKHPRFLAYWLSGGDQLLHTELSWRLILDHMPDYLMKVLTGARERLMNPGSTSVESPLMDGDGLS